MSTSKVICVTNYSFICVWDTIYCSQVVKWLSKVEKLIARLLSRPADFTFAELTSVLAFFGYKQVVAGVGAVKSCFF